MDRVERVARALALSEGQERWRNTSILATHTDSEEPKESDFDECLTPAEQDEWRGVARVAIAAAADEGPRVGSPEALHYGRIFDVWCKYRETLKQDDPYGDWPSFVAGAQARLIERYGRAYGQFTADTKPVTINGQVFNKVFNISDIEIVTDPTLKPGEWKFVQMPKARKEIDDRNNGRIATCDGCGHFESDHQENHCTGTYDTKYMTIKTTGFPNHCTCTKFEPMFGVVADDPPSTMRDGQNRIHNPDMRVVECGKLLEPSHTWRCLRPRGHADDCDRSVPKCTCGAQQGQTHRNECPFKPYALLDRQLDHIYGRGDQPSIANLVESIKQELCSDMRHDTAVTLLRQALLALQTEFRIG